MSENKIYGINGPVVTVKGETDLSMMETVYVGNSRLIGEVIRLQKTKRPFRFTRKPQGFTRANPSIPPARR